MPKVFYIVLGGHRRIGSFGVATPEVGVEVPPEVAAGFAGLAGYRVEGLDPTPPTPDPRKYHPEELGPPMQEKEAAGGAPAESDEPKIRRPKPRGEE